MHTLCLLISQEPGCILPPALATRIRSWASCGIEGRSLKGKGRKGASPCGTEGHTVDKRVKVVEATSPCRIDARSEEGEGNSSCGLFCYKGKALGSGQKFRIITKLGLASQRALEKLVSFQQPC